MRWRKALIVFLLLAGGLVLLVRSMLGQAHWSCEVCVDFQGSPTSCKRGSGATKDEAHRTALDAACVPVAPGMALSIACTNTPPSKMECRQR